ncbi:MAG: glycosyltransferase, partial [Lachnospiraceae bacterium]|nr:glycosyltransferase [Lachnospiraceae bacterium]
AHTDIYTRLFGGSVRGVKETACILPTRIDNLPNTCLEAMALGKVIISSTSENGTSVEQLITDGVNGFLAQVDDADDLYQKIVYVMQLPKDEKELIEKRAKERVSGLTPENVYKRMVEIYSEVIEKYKRNSNI